MDMNGSVQMRVRCGMWKLIAHVLVDTGAQVSLVRKGSFSKDVLNPSRRPLRLKVANGKIMGWGTIEATMGMEHWEHDGWFVKAV